MSNFNEKEFYKKLKPIISPPLILTLIGDPARKEFLYVSIEKEGILLPF